MRPIAKRAAQPLAKVVLPPGEDPWQRLKGERHEPRDAFLAYLELGSARLLTTLAERLGKPIGTIGRWSSEFCWLERAAAYDASVLTIHRERMAERGRAMVERQTEQGEAVEVALLEQVLRDVAEGRLEPKEALGGWLGSRKDNRAAVGLEGRGAVGGDRSVNVSVAVNVEDVEARVSALREQLAADLDAIGLDADQRRRLAERWQPRVIVGEVAR